MKEDEIIVAKIEVHRPLKIIQFLAECISESGKAAAMHPDIEI